MRLPAEALLSRLVALAGDDENGVSLEHGAVTFSVHDGWIDLEKVELEQRAVAIPVTGRVSLAGNLDLRVDLLPLVKLVGGGAYASVSRIASSIPVRVRGTLEDPEIEPPTAGDVGTSLLGGLIRRHLEPDADAP